MFGKSVVRSFDLFDTLIARRCGEAWRVFELVETRSCVPGFAKIREKAERFAECKGEYTIDDIYDKLAALLDLSEQCAKDLKALEISVELEEVVPIWKNLRLVRDGDIVVSDTYLPIELLGRMLTKAGLRRRVEIFRSARGKSAGTIWKVIRRRYHVALHVGDNAHSDVQSAIRRAIPARLTRVSRFSDTERLLWQMGLPGLAIMAREARLSLWHTDWLMRRLQYVQANFNFPLLLLASLRLLDVIESIGSTRVLFCSRDGNLWIHLFERLIGELGVVIETEYFYASRPARLNCSSDYLEYCRCRLGPEALVVDVAGTGWSMSNLVGFLGMSHATLFFVHHMPQMQEYERFKPSKDNIRVYSLMSKDDGPIWNVMLEMGNQADHASALDVQLRGSRVVPRLMPETRTAGELRAVAVQREAFLRSLNAVHSSSLRALRSVSPDKRKSAARAIYGKMAKERILSYVFGDAHIREDAGVMVSMGAIPPTEIKECHRRASVVVAPLKREARRLRLRLDCLKVRRFRE